MHYAGVSYDIIDKIERLSLTDSLMYALVKCVIRDCKPAQTMAMFLVEYAEAYHKQIDRDLKKALLENVTYINDKGDLYET